VPDRASDADDPPGRARGARYRDAGWPEDYDLVLRLLAAGHRIGMVPRRLLAWRDSSERLTRRHPAYAQERIVACKAAFLADGFLAGRDDYVLWGHGGTGRALRRALAAHGKRPALVVEVHPGRIGNRIANAPVVAPEDSRTCRAGGSSRRSRAPRRAG
jgi:hypothetical protein